MSTSLDAQDATRITQRLEVLAEHHRDAAPEVDEHGRPVDQHDPAENEDGLDDVNVVERPPIDVPVESVRAANVTRRDIVACACSAAAAATSASATANPATAATIAAAVIIAALIAAAAIVAVAAHPPQSHSPATGGARLA